MQGYNRGIVRKLLVFVSLGLLVFSYISAQNRQARDRRIRFPDVPGFLTLKCDLHIHTVFSDGAVWPDIRVQEAVRDGLDAADHRPGLSLGQLQAFAAHGRSAEPGDARKRRHADI